MSAVRRGKISLDVECNPLLGPLAEQVIQALEEGRAPDRHCYPREQLFTPEALTQEFIDRRLY